MGDAEADAPACMAPPGPLPLRRRARPHATDPPERLGEEIERRADVVGTVPTRPASPALGAVPREPDDEWQIQRRTL